MSTETLAPTRPISGFAIRQASAQAPLPSVAPEVEAPSAEALVRTAAAHTKTMDVVTRYRGEVAQSVRRSFFRRSVAAASVVACPAVTVCLVAKGAALGHALVGDLALGAGAGALASLSIGAVAWVGWIGIAAPKRSLKPAHIASLESAFSPASVEEKAVIAAIASNWLQRLDKHSIIGFAVRERLQVLAEAQVPEDARLVGERIANAFDAVFVVARDESVDHEWKFRIEEKNVNAIVSAAEALTPAERAVAGPILFDYLFKPNGAPRFEFGGFEIVSRLQRALRGGGASKTSQSPEVSGD